MFLKENGEGLPPSGKSPRLGQMPVFVSQTRGELAMCPWTSALPSMGLSLNNHKLKGAFQLCPSLGLFLTKKSHLLPHSALAMMTFVATQSPQNEKETAFVKCQLVRNDWQRASSKPIMMRTQAQLSRPSSRHCCLWRVLADSAACSQEQK